MLEILNDGRWHSVNEILQKTGLKSESLKSIINFLSEYNLILVDGKREKLRLNENFLKI